LEKIGKALNACNVTNTKLM